MGCYALLCVVMLLLKDAPWYACLGAKCTSKLCAPLGLWPANPSIWILLPWENSKFMCLKFMCLPKSPTLRSISVCHLFATCPHIRQGTTNRHNRNRAKSFQLPLLPGLPQWEAAPCSSSSSSPARHRFLGTSTRHYWSSSIFMRISIYNSWIMTVIIPQ